MSSQDKTQLLSRTSPVGFPSTGPASKYDCMGDSLEMLPVVTEPSSPIIAGVTVKETSTTS